MSDLMLLVSPPGHRLSPALATLHPLLQGVKAAFQQGTLQRTQGSRGTPFCWLAGGSAPALDGQGSSDSFVGTEGLSRGVFPPPLLVSTQDVAQPPVTGMRHTGARDEVACFGVLAFLCFLRLTLVFVFFSGEVCFFNDFLPNSKKYHEHVLQQGARTS